MPDLTPDELKAIELACMVLLEHARRGRQKQKEYIDIDNDPAAAAGMEPWVQRTDEARKTMRKLLAKHKESNDETQHA